MFDCHGPDGLSLEQCLSHLSSQMGCLQPMVFLLPGVCTFPGLEGSWVLSQVSQEIVSLIRSIGLLFVF